MKVYPKPSNGETLFLEILNPEEEYKVEIYSSIGEYINSINIDASDKEALARKNILSRFRLRNGSYLLKVRGRNQIESLKFTVK